MFSETYMYDDHQSNNIIAKCMYTDCSFNRFLFLKCLKLGIHRHGLARDSRILDQEEFYEQIMDDID